MLSPQGVLVKCDYIDCNELYDDEKAMLKHKKYDHKFHCNKCNYDAYDWDELLQHKIDAMAPFLVGHLKEVKHKKMKHIVCEFCGEEFKSFGGREAHRRQMHQADQQIRCEGRGMIWDEDKHQKVMAHCTKIFARASGLVFHIESGGCSFINKNDLYIRRQQQHIIKQIMEEPGKFFDALAQSKAFQQEPDNGEDGGVSLGLLDDSSAHITAPVIAPVIPPENIMDSEIPQPWGTINWGAVQASHEYSQKQDKRTNVFYSRFWDPASEDYNPEIYWNANENYYSCPIPGCSCKYDDLAFLEEHFQS